MCRVQFRRPLLKMFLLPAILLMAGCSENSVRTRAIEPTPREPLSIAAAANLKFAFDEIVSAFERQHPDVAVQVTYGASGNFFAQISQGAPFDVFFSADTKFPQKLAEERLALKESYFLYAAGRIVVWVRHDSPLDLDSLGIRSIIDPSVKKIAIANPRFAPYGIAAEEAMQTLGVDGEAQERLVLGENIAQAAHFVNSGAADVGILAMSLAVSPEMKSQGRYWEIPVDSHSPIEQAAVILTHCRNPSAAGQLWEFVAGPEGKAILASYGYSSPKEQTWTGQPSGSP